MTEQVQGNPQIPNLKAVGEEAQVKLDALAPRLPMKFRFDWRGVTFAGDVGSAEPVTVRLIGDLGGLPYSAEDANHRLSALDLLRQRQGPRFARTVSNRLTVSVTETMADTPDACQVVTAITIALLRARNAIDAALPLVARSTAGRARAAFAQVN